MNPQAAEIGTALDFCKTTQPLDFQIRDDLCHDVKCTWEKGLTDVERCAPASERASRKIFTLK